MKAVFCCFGVKLEPGNDEIICKTLKQHSNFYTLRRSLEKEENAFFVVYSFGLVLVCWWPEKGLDGSCCFGFYIKNKLIHSCVHSRASSNSIMAHEKKFSSFSDRSKTFSL